jgi:hypothetical protein
MTNLEKRIATLEQRPLAQQRSLQTTMEDAAGRLRESGQLELLLSACCADSDGRPLTDAEVSARRTYEELLRRECRGRGLPYPTELDHRRYIHAVMNQLIALKFGTSDLLLAEAALKAMRDGRTPSEDEDAALRTVDTEWQRLGQLASGCGRSQ